MPLLTSASRYGVVLDACTLIPMPLADTLLRLSHAQFFRPYWSESILDEVQRGLHGGLGISKRVARRRVESMRGAFPEAMVDGLIGHKYGLPDPDDEHVLETAIISEAQAIVTSNLKHFPRELCERYDIDIIGPDTFLINQLDFNPEEVRNLIYEQAGATKNPVLGLSDILEGLAHQAPDFSNRVTKLMLTDLKRLLERLEGDLQDGELEEIREHLQPLL